MVDPSKAFDSVVDTIKEKGTFIHFICQLYLISLFIKDLKFSVKIILSPIQIINYCRMSTETTNHYNYYKTKKIPLWSLINMVTNLCSQWGLSVE